MSIGPRTGVTGTYLFQFTLPPPRVFGMSGHPGIPDPDIRQNLRETREKKGWGQPLSR